MLLSIKLAWSFLKTGRTSFTLSTKLGVIGLALGVGSLIVAMAVVSGFETTLKNNIVDVVGHVMVSKKGAYENSADEILTQVKSKVDGIKAYTPYLWLEGLIVHKRKLNGIMIEGVELDSVENVLNFKHRIVDGKFDLGEGEDGVVKVIAGTSLVKNFNLKIGDTFKVAIPTAQDVYNTNMRPKVVKLRLSGIIELGRYEYNQRFIMMDLSSAQKIINKPRRISGFRMLLDDPDRADMASIKINSELGYPYYSRSWKDQERNLFQAVKLEKMVIFFVLLIIVVAACFNVASTLFVSVLKRYQEIGLLKAMGMKKWDVVRIFTWQGLFIGVLGNVLGLGVGLLACGFFMLMQKFFEILPAKAYRVTYINVDLRFEDMLMVFAASLLICLVSSLVPAFRGAKLNAVEGLRYE